ncbi:hypothetical protein [Halalkalibacter urbisdiaboli]|uniref:hypothetical protein n=1 Tax=Halalkalibacter urbisdiaboli TaxID=1960589 RepID=UPI000B4546CB|nr:hypothetical protein [Halalkalibacter urbisdiaboli]
MPKMCPVCNGFTKVNKHCNECNSELIDYGRILDYLDDYSAYEEIEVEKESDTVEYDQRNHLCAHYLTCIECSYSVVYLIQEQ